MNLDKAKIQSMIEKELPITMHSEDSSNNEQLIGITSDMSKSDILKHLRQEYTKWNSRITNSDPKVQEQAKKMIEIISELRTKYK